MKSEPPAPGVGRDREGGRNLDKRSALQAPPGRRRIPAPISRFCGAKISVKTAPVSGGVGAVQYLGGEVRPPGNVNEPVMCGTAARNGVRVKNKTKGFVCLGVAQWQI